MLIVNVGMGLSVKNMLDILLIALEAVFMAQVGNILRILGKGNTPAFLVLGILISLTFPQDTSKLKAVGIAMGHCLYLFVVLSILTVSQKVKKLVHVGVKAGTSMLLQIHIVAAAQ